MASSDPTLGRPLPGPSLARRRLAGRRWGGLAWLSVAVAGLFAFVVLIDGAPSLGSDVGGILTLVPVFGLTLLVLSGRRLTTRAVEHGLPAFAVRFDAGASLTYSGDTTPCRSLTELAAGTDVLLCEAESAVKTSDMAHHTPEDAGDTATEASAGRLIVTRVGRFLTPQEAVTRASARYGGEVDYATPGTTFTVG